MFGLNKSRTLNFDYVFRNVETDRRDVIGTMNEEDCVIHCVCENKLLLLLLSSSSSLSPLRRVFVHIFLKQTMSLGSTLLQLFCCYCLWCLYHYFIYISILLLLLLLPTI
jgi:hypothetical protein